MKIIFYPIPKELLNNAMDYGSYGIHVTAQKRCGKPSHSGLSGIIPELKKKDSRHADMVISFNHLFFELIRIHPNNNIKLTKKLTMFKTKFVWINSLKKRPDPWDQSI